MSQNDNGKQGQNNNGRGPQAQGQPGLPALLPGQRGYVVPSAAQWDQLRRMGEEAYKSGLLPASIKNPAAAAIVALKAYELGIPLMEGFAEIHVIDGKTTLSTIQMQKLVARNMPELSWRVESTDKWCKVSSVKLPRNKEPLAVTWTIEDAQRAQLTNKDNWKKYPKAMLAARALSAFFRLMCPEALCGCNYTPEELQNAGPDGEPVGQGAIETTGRKLPEAKDVPAEPGAPAGTGSGAGDPPGGPSPAQPAEAPAPAPQLSSRQQALIEASRHHGWKGTEVKAYLRSAWNTASHATLSEPQFQALLDVMTALTFTDATNELTLRQAERKAEPQVLPAEKERPPEPQPTPAEGNSSLFDQIMDRHVRGTPPADQVADAISREPGEEG